MAGYDWSKYRKALDDGDTLWETSAQAKERMDYEEQSNILYQRLTAARSAEAQAHLDAEQAAKTQKAAQVKANKVAAAARKKALDNPVNITSTTRFLQNESIYNFDASRFNSSIFTKEYKGKLDKEYKTRLEAEYTKISNYKPNPKIVKEDTVSGKLTTFDKFKNQTLGVFGGIKNLDKPKTVYQWRGGTIQDPVTKEDQDVIWENVMQISVVAEDKNFYYYRLKDGTIQSVNKDHVMDKIDLEEQKARFMENQVKNKKNVASMTDKIAYNISQGLMKTVAGSATKEQLDTGNTAVNLASNITGEALGFALPTGGGTSIAGGLEKVSQGVLGKVSQKAPSVIGTKLAGGLPRAVAKGSIEMGAFSALQDRSEQTKKDMAKSILEDMIAGGIFMGTIYGTSKGLSKLVSVWKDIPSTKETNNLLTAARNEYENAIDDIAKRDITSTETKILTEEANTKLLEDVKDIASKYENVSSNEIPFPAKVSEKAPSNAVKETSKGTGLNLQTFAEGETSEIASSNANIAKTKEHIISRADIKNTKENLFDKMYRNVIDRNRGLYRATVTAGAKKNIATENPYKMADLTSTYEGVAKSNIEQGISDKNGKIIGDSLKSIIKKVPKNKSEELADYMVLKQAAYLAEHRPEVAQVYPKEWNISLADMKTKLAKYEADNPSFSNLATKFTFYNKRLMGTQLVESGLLSAEDAQAIQLANPNYIPNKRAFTNVEMSKQQKGKAGFVGQGDQIKTRTGSERQILNPYESMIENTFNFAKAAKRNEVGSTLYKLVEKDPEKFKGLIDIVQKVDEGKDLGQAIDGGDLATFVDRINEGFEIKGVKDLSKPNIVRVRIKGESKYMQIHDAALLDNLTQLDNAQINTAVEGMRAVTNAMKSLTTGINPMFGLARNIWRDVVTGYVQSKTTSKIPVYSYAKYMGELVASAIGTIGKSKNYKTFRSLGGGFFSSAVGTEKNLLKETANKYTKGVSGKLKTVARSPISAMEWLNNTLETMPRYAEYNRTVKQLTKKGVDEYSAKMEGLYNSQEVTVNFKRSGNVTKTADAFVPYLNAAVQGLDKVLRTVDPRNPAQLANVVVKGLTSITLPALMLYAINKDNPDYQQLSDYYKDNNFLIPVDKLTSTLYDKSGGKINISSEKGMFIKIPKPREFGILFGSLAERIARDYSEQDPEAWKNFFDAIKTNFAPPNVVTENMSAPIIRNVMSPEGRTWRGTPVVNAGLLKQSAKNQYDENTSKIAQYIGEKLNFAPKKVDDIMSSYLGGVAQIGKPLTSNRTMNEQGVIKAAVEVLKKQVTADSKYNTDLADEFYKNLETANTKKADMNAAGKLKGKGETYIDSATYNLNGIAEQLSDLRKKQKSAKTNEEKDKIQVKMNNIMQKANDNFRENYTNKQKMTLLKRSRAFTRSE